MEAATEGKLEALQELLDEGDADLAFKVSVRDINCRCHFDGDFILNRQMHASGLQSSPSLQFYHVC